jgi:AraC-like DNA-binding protein
MMVALSLYSHCCGRRSARAIERACEVDIAYRVIAAHTKPDHATIARFVERHERALAGLFGAVLGLCAQAGLAKVGIVAIGGTKVAANASRDATRDHEQIAREILEEAKAIDAAEDELNGEARATSVARVAALARARRPSPTRRLLFRRVRSTPPTWTHGCSKACAAHQAGLGQRALRVHAPRPVHRARRRALPTTTTTDRAGVCQHSPAGPGTLGARRAAATIAVAGAQLDTG